ncbi:DUF3073 domain-containing protein [Corynebacterium freiburgense]|uniref:DUF3073 domain-containing protein n=1 Tax=Corynebacterium freiburgense TaxID=556548 RepID=UPI0003F5D878|nr:DUF3073 domain-containing protein [Corynebacterium freiburgense]WJZ03595.1 hypothetical protein CFREI_11685 [Corynebacterium freiburgense]
MGRGRAKAKQAKVARQLKYNSPEMDLASLQRELAGKSGNESSRKEDDQYAEWADWDDHDAEDEQSWR